MSEEAAEVQEESTQQSAKLLYSPAQASTATFFGGPLAATYAIVKNFEVMGDEAKASHARWLGIAFTLLLVLVVYSLPEDVSANWITALYAIATLYLVRRYQLDKEQIASSESFDFRSNWNVVAVTLLGFVALMLVISIAAVLLVMMGFDVPIGELETATEGTG